MINTQPERAEMAKRCLMIYVVECDFSDPAREAEWNAFYDRVKLPALLSVAGFQSSQRFKRLGQGGPAYMAAHSIRAPAVLQGEAYRQKGGGDFAQWQSCICNWRRNLYAGLDVAPAIGQDEVLLMSALGPQPLLDLGLSPTLLTAVALDQAPARRWWATSKVLANGAESLPGDVQCYAPLTSWLTGSQATGRGD